MYMYVDIDIIKFRYFRYMCMYMYVDFDIIKFVSTYICAYTCLCKTYFFPVEILSGGKNLILNF